MKPNRRKLELRRSTIADLRRASGGRPLYYDPVDYTDACGEAPDPTSISGNTRYAATAQVC